jgi:hypothetical protein
MLALLVAGGGKVSQGLSFAVPVPGLPADRESVFVVADRVTIPAHLVMDVSEVAEG